MLTNEWNPGILERIHLAMRPLMIAAAGCLALPSCSDDKQAKSTDLWVTAASLEPPRVAYTPNPIITARETRDGLWDWRWEKRRYQGETETGAIDQALMLSEVAAAKTLRPTPMILFSFAEHANSSELSELKARIAGAAGCSREFPCIEGTPEQLR